MSERTPGVTASASASDLTTLSPAELISRINDLESRLKFTTAQLAALTSAATDSVTIPQSSPVSTKVVKQKKPPKPFEFSKYSTRHIALKFAYLGQRYNGLEHSNGGSVPPRPTIEEALWKALRKARLIPPDVPEGCDGSFEVVFDETERDEFYRQRNVRLEIDWKGLTYSKCGRTDKGVSAFGQVVGVTVRSNRPKRTDSGIESEDTTGNEAGAEGEKNDFDDVKDELNYIYILNQVLPSDIRILAWCPDPGPAFDARFSCGERRYKYFFTNPAFCPTPGVLGLNHASGKPAPVREGWLDIEMMRKAAKKLEGLHDFRNFCKIDASKQMSSCERRVTFANIEEMSDTVGLNQLINDPMLNSNGKDMDISKTANGFAVGAHSEDSDVGGPKVYAFAVHGTAFLWHQVRCMVAVLFLVGQGLEQPEVVDQLFDIAQTPGRPHYEMADDAPLVLWDCIFPGNEMAEKGEIKWIYVGDEASVPNLTKKGDNQFDGKFGTGGLVTDLWAGWRQSKIEEILTAGLLNLALSQGDNTSTQRSGLRIGANSDLRSQRVFDGGTFARIVGDYVPVMRRPQMETLEVQNTKYRMGKQARRDLKSSMLSNQ